MACVEGMRLVRRSRSLSSMLGETSLEPGGGMDYRAVGAGPTSTRGAAVGEALAFHAPGFLELTP